MKALVFGSSGFVGQHVVERLTPEYEVHETTRTEPEAGHNHHVDLLDQNSVEALVRSVSPDLIVNCAGVVGAPGDFGDNITFTRHILEAAKLVDNLEKIVICGSAAVYGSMQPNELPVSEEHVTVPSSEYGESKLEEERTALEYQQKYGIPVVVARIFNPLGPRMKPRFLTSRILQQVEELKNGERKVIELSRLDAERDYLGIDDVASAVESLLMKGVSGEVYNVGSGIPTTNGQLARKIIEVSDIDGAVDFVQTSGQPEPTVASQADISKIKNDTGWIPSSTLDMIIEEIVHGR